MSRDLNSRHFDVNTGTKTKQDQLKLRSYTIKPTISRILPALTTKSAKKGTQNGKEFMKKRGKLRQLPKSAVELPYTELFGSPSPVYNEDLTPEIGRVEDGGSTGCVFGPSSSDMGNTDWEWMQEYSDISNALENCPGIYERCVDINEICCKTERQMLTGPTLAELNERRAMSPLINPDMKRLHLVATKSDSEKLNQFYENGINRLPSRSCLMEINHPIPRKCHVSEAVVPLSQVKNENIPTTFRRMLVYGVNRPGALNSYVNVENNIGSDKVLETRTVPHEENASLIAKSDNLKVEDVPREVDTPSEASDREVETIGDDDMSSGSDEDDDDFDDESTPTKFPRHSRKRKRSEAEDMTPNPKKLYEIGKQLDRLNRIINGLRPMDQSSANAKNRTRREKNKLASRACRLKKKAGHEANKIKFFGLNQENKNLTDLLCEAKNLLIENMKNKMALQSWVDVEQKIKKILENQVAGRMSEYVDSVLMELPDSMNTSTKKI